MSHRLSIAVLVVLSAIAACADLENPPVTQRIVWDSPRTEELATRACMPCHSNETEWAWYANVPGVDVALVADVENARRHMNFSEWDRPQDDAHDAAEKVLDREMPPAMFFLGHPEANLSDEERQELADGLLRTFQADPPLNDDGDSPDDD